MEADPKYKTVDERYKEYDNKSKRAQLEILSHYLGCRKECNMTEEEALLDSIDFYFGNKYGFVKPLQFNITKYKPIVAKKYPKLNVDNRTFTEWTITYIYE